MLACGWCPGLMGKLSDLLEPTGSLPTNGFWVRGRKRHGEAAEDAGLWVREGRANLEDGPRLRHGYSTGSRHLVARRQRSTEPSAAARWRALLRAGFVLG